MSRSTLTRSQNPFPIVLNYRSVRLTDEDFFRILSALPKETQDYVPKLIAAARVGSNPEQYGLAD